ncbi:Cell surface protein [Labilithrix luteola]|uniref:Cell surface protein n=1 Tax=Labilithrix luteola TaxID=1391654 RepID=A0A0K1Q680_9BACT|nr:Cell surface protein [Labilithrix luteola]
MVALSLACACVSSAALLACSSSDAGTSADEKDAAISLGDAGYLDVDVPDGDKPRVDGGFEGPDGGVIREDRFITEVVSFTPGECAGFGLTKMPGVVEGPPVGGGELAGSLDVVSFGKGGEMIVGFGENAIVDGPGVDFIVFENAFWAGGNPNAPSADLAEVSVSEDGTTWKTFTCTDGTAPPFGDCAGWHPVYSSPSNGISPIDPAKAGGDQYDIGKLGLTTARFVKIRDLGTQACPSTPNRPTTVGFDLDAISIVNAKLP